MSKSNKLTKKDIIRINKYMEEEGTRNGHNFSFIKTKQVRGAPEMLECDRCLVCGCTMADLYANQSYYDRYDSGTMADLYANQSYYDRYDSTPDGKFVGMSCNEVVIKTLLE